MNQSTPPSADALQLRPATNADGPGVADLIETVFKEYGEVLCLEDADADLLDLEQAYAGRGGAFGFRVIAPGLVVFRQP